MKAFLLAAIALIFTVTGAIAQDGYRVRSGDTLAVEVLQDPSLNRSVLITPDGSISFPFAGSLQVQGFTIQQIADRLADSIASNFATRPNVFVSVAGLRPVVPGGPRAPTVEPTITVYFLGEVGEPGARDVAPGTTFLQGLSQSGGLSNFAAERRIQMRRTDPVTHAESLVTIDYRALQRGAVLNSNFTLIEGDVILVPQRRLFE